jgi:hypothetical protein
MHPTDSEAAKLYSGHYQDKLGKYFHPAGLARLGIDEQTASFEAPCRIWCRGNRGNIRPKRRVVAE